MAKFTATTKFSSTDAEYVYEDMKGMHWRITQAGGPARWMAYPQADAVAAYDLKASRQFAAATDAAGMIAAVEDRLQLARDEKQSPGAMFYPADVSSFPWWLVIGLILLTKKKRR